MSKNSNVSVAIVYHSSYGHTKVLAESVAAGVGHIPDVTAKLVSVADVDAHWDDLDHATAIIFGAPTYMGSVSAGFWQFAEKTSKRWFTQAWKDKLAAGFVNSGSQNGDKLQTLHALYNLSQQHSMLWVSLGLLPGNNSSKGGITDLNRLGAMGGAFAQSNTDEGAESAPPQSDRLTAEHLGQRVAEAAVRWARGAA